MRIYGSTLAYLPVSVLAVLRGLLPLRARVLLVVTAPMADSRHAALADLAAMLQWTTGDPHAVHVVADIPVFVDPVDPARKTFGYGETDAVLERIYAREWDCRYTLITNGDNLYAAGLGERLAPHMQHEQLDLIGWSFVVR
jgi:hypothetical protein